MTDYQLFEVEALALDPTTYQLMEVEVEGVQGSILYQLMEVEAQFFVPPEGEPINVFLQDTMGLIDTAFDQSLTRAIDFTDSLAANDVVIVEAPAGSTHYQAQLADDLELSDTAIPFLNIPPGVITDVVDELELSDLVTVTLTEVPEFVQSQVSRSTLRTFPARYPGSDYRWDPAYPPRGRRT